MNKQISQALGWAVGVLVVFPLIIYGISYIFKPNKNNASHAINTYVLNCENIKLHFPVYAEYTTSFKHYSTSLLSPKESIYKILFKEPSLNKYLEITFFNYPLIKSMSFSDALDNKKIIISINKDDLKNLKYGIKANPVPVFRVVEDLPDSISRNRGSEDGWNVDITENQFKYNVEQYLTYIMPKEEFQKRFEKKK